MDDSRHSVFCEILGRLLRSLLHDFNGPLSSIIGYSSKNVSRSLDPAEDWQIVYEQGLLLSENIKYWQNVARRQIPHYDGNVVKAAKYVFRAFKTLYASKLTLEWEENCLNDDSARINLKQAEQLYFWAFLFNYFVQILPDRVKGKLKIKFCDSNDVLINAELQADNLVQTSFTRKLSKYLLEIIDKIAFEKEITDNKIKISIRKNS